MRTGTRQCTWARLLKKMSLFITKFRTHLLLLYFSRNQVNSVFSLVTLISTNPRANCLTSTGNMTIMSPVGDEMTARMLYNHVPGKKFIDTEWLQDKPRYLFLSFITDEYWRLRWKIEGGRTLSMSSVIFSWFFSRISMNYN